MSKIEVDTIAPQSGTNLAIGEAGDSLTFQNSVIPNSALANGQITINGVSVSLGGSATIPTETQPVISSFTPTVIDADVGGTITITGQNFASIPKVELQRANGAFQSATSVTFTSATTISFTTGTAGLTNGQNVRILVTNPDGNAARSSSDLVVSDGPVFVTTSLANGEANVSYSANVDVTADSAVTIALNTGSSLPSGISLGSTSNVSGTTYRAVLSGTLPAAGSETTYNFTLKATDAQSQVTTQALSITAEVGINNAGGFC
tara:strand:+ start:212 stop:1000 length:789 start_codon:yes stop_codon:yes gene_type:complete